MAYKIWQHPTTASCPTVYTHSFSDDGSALWTSCQQLGCPTFHLVCIYDLPMDAALTPWPSDPVRKGQAPFPGEAKKHLQMLCEDIVPEVEHQLSTPSSYNALAGYSLAGLFTLWSATQTGIFHRLACASASFWYPNFLSFLQQHHFVENPECVYLSLGDKESKTRHPLMQQIETDTAAVLQILKERGINTYFEMNPGNHFTEPSLRMAKAIRWMLAQ